MHDDNGNAKQSKQADQEQLSRTTRGQGIYNFSFADFSSNYRIWRVFQLELAGFYPKLDLAGFTQEEVRAFSLEI